MEKLEIIQQELKEILSEKRYNHSVRVMKKAIELANQYGVDSNIAALTGIAHDIAKEMPNNEKLDYVKKNNMDIDEIELHNVGLLHGKIGADIAEKKYNFTDEMQKAIKYHTTAHTDMSLLAKIIFIADKIEDGRDYAGVEELRKLAKEDIDKCMIAQLSYDIKKNINKGVLVHPDSILARNKLILQNMNKKF